MAKLNLGSKPKVTVGVENLPSGVYLSSPEVEVDAYFYGSNRPSQQLHVTKDNMNNEDEGDSNNLFCIVNTTGFAEGKLMVEIEVKYPIEGSVEKVTQRSTASVVGEDGTSVTLVKTEIVPPAPEE